MPKVNVIIPTYNRADLLAEAIRSVLEQTFRDFEVIIVDDGSVDNTAEVVRSFHDPRVIYRYQKNSGVAIARNTGILASDSEYVAFLDSDDALLDTALEKGVKVLDEHPEVGFSYAPYLLLDEDGHIFYRQKSQHKQPYIRDGIDQLKELLERGNYIIPSTMLVRRRCLNSVGLFDPIFRPGSEDFDLIVRLVQKYQVAVLVEPLAKYRIHRKRISAGRKLDEIENKHLLILERIFNHAGTGPLLATERPKAYFYLYLRLAGYAIGNSDRKTAIVYLSKALKTCPGVYFFKHGLIPWTYTFAKSLVPNPILSQLKKLKYLKSYVDISSKKR